MKPALKYKARNLASKAKHYTIIASVVLNCIAVCGLLGFVWLQGSGYMQESKASTQLDLRKIAYLSQAVPASQLHEMPVEQVAYSPMPPPGRNPFYGKRVQ